MIARYLAAPALLLVLIMGCDTPTNTAPATPAPAGPEVAPAAAPGGAPKGPALPPPRSGRQKMQ
jgi:hypothetical protein